LGALYPALEDSSPIIDVMPISDALSLPVPQAIVADAETKTKTKTNGIKNQSLFMFLLVSKSVGRLGIESGLKVSSVARFSTSGNLPWASRYLGMATPMFIP
tara:strand:- start:1364 stop:1669 length:306 start_codon:yes stop_codon:yes gene_type:complete